MGSHEHPVIIFTDAQHTHTEKRSARQVERLMCFAFAQTLQFSVAGHGCKLSQICVRKFDDRVRLDTLYRIAHDQLDVSAQNIVPAHNLYDRALKDDQIKRSDQFPSYADVAGGIARRQLIEEPETLLLQRKRRCDRVTMIG